MSKTKEPKYPKLFEENVLEDESAIIDIAELSSKVMEKDLKLYFLDEKRKERDYRIPIAIFIKTFDAIVKELIKLEKSYSSFEINFANRFLMGFDNHENEEDEKEGNFMVYIFHVNQASKDTEYDDADTETSLERAVKWINENIKDNPEVIKRISENAVEELKAYDIILYSQDLIAPIFSIMYDTCVKYLKDKRREIGEDEYEINFAGCFFISARESEDGIDTITIRPSIESKTGLKDDARSKIED